MVDTCYNAIALCSNFVDKEPTTALINGYYNENFSLALEGTLLNHLEVLLFGYLRQVFTRF